MVRAILFDVLGTLLDRGVSGAQAHENAMRRALSSVDALVRMPPYDEFRRAYETAPDPPGVFDMEKKLRGTLQGLGLKPRAQKELAARMASRYWLEQGASLRKLPDVDACLGALPEDVRLGVVTNWPDGDSLRAALDRTRLLFRFDALGVSGEVGAEKPDPRLFLAALKPLGVEPGDALVVGDDLAGDLVPARALGMRTALVRYPRTSGEPMEPMPGIDLALGSLEELPAALGRLRG